MMTRLAILACLTGVVACAASGGRTADPITRVGISSGAGSMGVTELHNDASRAVNTVAAPVDSVWLALPRVYETLGIPDVGAVPRQRAYGARGFRPRRIEGKRLSTYIDCGMGLTATPKADDYAITMSLISTLTADSDSTTMIETVLEASGASRSAGGQVVRCQSKGTLEARVGEVLTQLLFGEG